MVEKWLQRSSNHYTNVRAPVRRVPVKRYSPTSARYGKPNVLFKDSDHDGVANVFDCQPHNKRRQDVVAPSPSGNPMMDMHYRQEVNRQYKAYMKEMERYNQELERINSPYSTHSTEYKVLVLGGGNDVLGRPIKPTTKEVTETIVTTPKETTESSSSTGSSAGSSAGMFSIGTGNVVKNIPKGTPKINVNLKSSGPYALSKTPTLVSTVKALVSRGGKR